MTDTNVISSAGTSFAVSATLPASHDDTGFQALTFVPIGEIVDGGTSGRKYTIITHDPLSGRETIKLKGSYEEGSPVLKMGRDIDDAGQALLIAGRDVDDLYAFEVVYQDGAKDWFTALITSYEVEIGSMNTVVAATVALEQTHETIHG